MSLAFDDATHFWEDKLRNPWQSGTKKIQQLTAIVGDTKIPQAIFVSDR